MYKAQNNNFEQCVISPSDLNLLYAILCVHIATVTYTARSHRDFYETPYLKLNTYFYRNCKQETPLE
jgi:hypothetical protein